MIRSACLVVLLSAAVSLAQIGFNLSSIARTGDAASIPQQLVQVYSPSLSDSGDVAFAGDNAVFLRSNATTSILAAFGDPAPGAGSFTYAMSPSINAQGQVAFAGSGADAASRGIFLSTQDGLYALVRAGDPAPGGGSFTYFYDVSSSSAGQLAFRASVQGPRAQRRGLFLIFRGSPQALAYAGDPAPGGSVFSSFYSPAVNSSGAVAFAATLNPSGAGIFLAQPDGTLIAVARRGDPAPGGGRLDFSFATSSATRLRELIRDPAFRLERIFENDRRTRLNAGASPARTGDGNATFVNFRFPISINDNGDIAFAASTSIVGRGGVFLFSNFKLTRRIREGDPVPGGGNILAVDQVALNAAGQIAFQAYLSTSDFGLFLFSPDGTTTAIARHGQPSPEGDSFTYPSSPSLNAVGQVAFTAELVNSLGGAYIWSGGPISRVAGQGDPIDRTPKFIDPYPMAIDGTGRVLFWANLFPGSYGLFLGAPPTPVAIVGDPAPGGGVFDYLSIFQSVMNDTGQAVFPAYATPLMASGLYSFSDAVLTRIVAQDDPAPGGGTFFDFGSASLNHSGDVAFVGFASFPSRSGLYLMSKAGFRSLIAFGDPAPRGGTFSSFPFLSLNDQTQLAFAAPVTLPGQPGIFRWSEDNVVAIAQTGDPAPGGGIFNFTGYSSYPFYAPSLNNFGEVAFGALIDQYGDSGVYKFSGHAISSVAIPGDLVPRVGEIFFADTATLNDAGQVSFFVDGTINLGVALASEGTRSAIAVIDDPAPGGGRFNYVDVPILNAHTQVAFLGGLPDGYGAFLANPIR